MKFLNKLENILLGEENIPSRPITEARLNCSTAAAFGISALVSACTAYYFSDHDPVTVTAASDAAGLVAYQLAFIPAYIKYNLDRYKVNGRFNYRLVLYELVFKIAPAGGVSAFITFHTFRDLIQASLISIGVSGKYAPIASLLSDLGAMAPYIFTRNKILDATSAVRNSRSKD